MIVSAVWTALFYFAFSLSTNVDKNNSPTTHVSAPRSEQYEVIWWRIFGSGCTIEKSESWSSYETSDAEIGSQRLKSTFPDLRHAQIL